MFRDKNGRNNIIIKLLILVLLLPLISGCWDRRELNKRAIVAGLGLDSSPREGQILVSAQIIDPTQAKTPQTSGGGGGEPAWIITSQGSSLFEALRNMVHICPRKPFFPHNQIIIFGEDLARKGIKDHIDMLSRDYEFRETNWIIISEGKAQDILAAKTRINSISAFYIRNQIDERVSSSKATAVNLVDFSDRIMSKSTVPIASYIRFENQGKEKRLLFSETAVFNQDLKLAGILNDRETRGLLWVLGEVKSGIIVVENPSRKGKYSLEILEASRKIIPEIKDGKPVITVRIQASSNLGETSCAEDLLKPEKWKLIKELQNQAIREEVITALKKAQAMNTDVFGFGEAFHKKYPRQWREMEADWQGIFPALEVKILVESKMKRPGLIISNVFTEKGD